MYSRFGHQNREPLNFAQSFRKAADYCASEEHCKFDIVKKFHDWRIDSKFRNEILDQLIEEDYINELRYAKAFVRGKFKNLHWGKIKITGELRAKGISSNLITQAMQEEIKEEEYQACAKQLFDKKLQELGANNKENRHKAVQFLVGKGFGDIAFSINW